MLFLYLYLIFVKKGLIIGPTKVNLYFSLKDYPGKSNFVHEYLGEIAEKYEIILWRSSRAYEVSILEQTDQKSHSR